MEGSDWSRQARRWLAGWLALLAVGCSAPGTTRTDAGTADAGPDASGSGGSDGGSGDAGLWPVGALWLEATSRGGFPTPLCSVDGGTVDGSNFKLTADGRFEYAVCELVVPYPSTEFTSGTLVVDAGQLARFDAAMGALTRSSVGSCGADKRVLVLRVETSGGTLRYADDFYACWREPGTVYVQRIDGVFTLFAEWARVQ